MGVEDGDLRLSPTAQYIKGGTRLKKGFLRMIWRMIDFLAVWPDKPVHKNDDEDERRESER